MSYQTIDEPISFESVKSVAGVAKATLPVGFATGTWTLPSAKRIFDVVAAAAMLLVLSPVFCVLALLVATDGGSVFYSHRRVGRGMAPFGCLKFRTMIPGAEPCLVEYLEYHPEAAAEWNGSRKLRFDPRVTTIGRLLRRTSLDELPQLINVVAGQMSLVGPRPVTSDEVPLYGAQAAAYAASVPGITGPWQVSGRSDIDYDTRVAMDVAYAKGRSFFGDMRILVATSAALATRRGAR